jgi:hypothetical protein
MSELDYDRQIIDAIRDVMEEPQLSAEEQIERKCDSIIRELDELCRMATLAETVDLVASQKMALGQMLVRIQLILSFVLASKPPAFKVIRNG